MQFLAFTLLFTFSVQFFSVYAEEISIGSGEFIPPIESGALIPLIETGSVIVPAAETGSIMEEKTSTGIVMELLPIYSPLLVRINEVMWMGSDLSTADEWIEIAAIPALTGSVITSFQSLNGWTVTTVKGTTETPIVTFGEAHNIGSGGLIVASNFSASASRLRLEPEVISSAVSLPNTQLLLRLRDASGSLIDEVDDGVGAPFAGANPSGGTKASMERIDLRQPGVLKANWRTADTVRGFDKGANVRGTPGYFNGSIEAIDTTPPLPPADIRAYSVSGGLVVLWKPVIADDLDHHLLTIPAASGSSIVKVLPATATGAFMEGIEEMGALNIQSVDISGNQSDISVISVQPLLKPIISELLPDLPGADDIEWIELHNPYEWSLNLEGWRLRSGSRIYALPGGTGSVIKIGDYMMLGADVTGLSLPNAGGSVELSVMGRVVDRFSYGQSVEGVSFTRLGEGGDVAPSCRPTPGSGTGALPGIMIAGLVSEGADPLTLNLQAVSSGGTLAGAMCYWNFGDGYTHEGCNPPAHRMRIGGDLLISLEVKDYCGNTMTQSSTVKVLQKKSTKEQAPKPQCTPSSFSGITITEFMPAPTPAEKEWIELRSVSQSPIHMCGWWVDDTTGGSKPYSLPDRMLGSGEYLLLPREETGIALNNDQDSVRLIAPLTEGGTGVFLSIPYYDAPAEQSFALRFDGAWLWSDFPSPGAENTFREIDLSRESAPVILSAALPNPAGEDAYNEWIELTNITMRPQWLNGWSIRTQSGKSLVLDGIVLARKETVRLKPKDTSFGLKNSEETLLLSDPEGYIRSVLGWIDADSDEVIKVLEYESIALEDVTYLDDLILKGRKVSSDPENTEKIFQFSVPVIDLYVGNNFESYDLISALIKNKNIELKNDSISGIQYVVADGVDIATVLLEAGLAYVPGGIEFSKRIEYQTYEYEARKNKRGIWASEESASEMDEVKADQASDIAAQKGMMIKADVPSGLIESGTVLHVTSNVPSTLFMAYGTGAFHPFSGSLVINEGQYSFYAEYAIKASGSGSIRSDVLIHEYAVKRSFYPSCIRISEIYPSPQKGELEWIELFNKCEQGVNLLGWLIDDEQNAGSRPFSVKRGLSIPAKGYITLSGSSLPIAFNNGGDYAIIQAPTGSIQDAVLYPSIKKAMTYALLEDSYCLTAKPSPGKENECVAPVKLAKKSKKSVKKLIIGVKTAYKDIFTPETLESGENADFSLYSGLSLNNRTQNVYNKRPRIVISIVLFLIGLICLIEALLRIRYLEQPRKKDSPPKGA